MRGAESLRSDRTAAPRPVRMRQGTRGPHPAGFAAAELFFYEMKGSWPCRAKMRVRLGGRWKKRGGRKVWGRCGLQPARLFSARGAGATTRALGSASSLAVWWDPVGMDSLPCVPYVGLGPFVDPAGRRLHSTHSCLRLFPLASLQIMFLWEKRLLTNRMLAAVVSEWSSHPWLDDRIRCRRRLDKDREERNKCCIQLYKYLQVITSHIQTTDSWIVTY